MRRDAMRAIVVLLSLLAFPATAQEVYKWTDDQGVVHFSDSKPADQTTQTLHIEAAPASPTPATPTTAPSAPDTSAPTRKPPLNITMYSTADCSYCKRARRYFAARNLRYAERDISNRQHHAQWTQLGGRAVPLFVING